MGEDLETVVEQVTRVEQAEWPASAKLADLVARVEPVYQTARAGIETTTAVQA